MAEETGREVKLSEILETSQLFSNLITYIPTKYYIEDEEQQWKLQSNKKRKKGKNNKTEDKKLLAKKSKMLKLDPSTFKTTEELQLEIEKREEELYSEEPEINGNERIKVSNIPSVPLDELREKLHSKMEQLKGNRKDSSEGKREKREQKKTKKLKQKKASELSKTVKHVTSLEDVGRINKLENNNNNNNIVFNKFDFSGENQIKTRPKKNLKKLLEKAENRQELLSSLEKTDVSKAQDLRDKFTWENAMKKAEGQKIRDDPKLLKKSIKKREKVKEQSRKKWKEREGTVEKQRLEKQKLRRQHLKERTEKKLSKKNRKSK